MSIIYHFIRVLNLNDDEIGYSRVKITIPHQTIFVLFIVIQEVLILET